MNLSKKLICVPTYLLLFVIPFFTLSCASKPASTLQEESGESETSERAAAENGKSGENQVGELEIKELIQVKSWEWQGAGFGAGGLLREITLENQSYRHVKNIKVKIYYLGTPGTKQGYEGPTTNFIIQDLLPAGTKKTFRNINVGFRHPDARNEYLRVLSVEVVE